MELVIIIAAVVIMAVAISNTVKYDLEYRSAKVVEEVAVEEVAEPVKKTTRRKKAA